MTGNEESDEDERSDDHHSGGVDLAFGKKGFDEPAHANEGDNEGHDSSGAGVLRPGEEGGELEDADAGSTHEGGEGVLDRVSLDSESDAEQGIEDDCGVDGFGHKESLLGGSRDESRV